MPISNDTLSSDTGLPIAVTKKPGGNILNTGDKEVKEILEEILVELKKIRTGIEIATEVNLL
jgi:hypothetical protein